MTQQLCYMASVGQAGLSHGHLEMYGCMISTMATYMLEHQAIGFRNTDLSTTLDSYTNITFTMKNARYWNYILRKLNQLFKG